MFRQFYQSGSEHNTAPACMSSKPSGFEKPMPRKSRDLRLGIRRHSKEKKKNLFYEKLAKQTLKIAPAGQCTKIADAYTS